MAAVRRAPAAASAAARTAAAAAAIGETTRQETSGAPQAAPSAHPRLESSWVMSARRPHAGEGAWDSIRRPVDGGPGPAVPSGRHATHYHSGPGVSARSLLTVVVLTLVVGWVVLGLPVGASLLYRGGLPAGGASTLARGTVRLLAHGRWADPASAYPPAVRAGMPAGAGWWAAAAWSGTLGASLTFAVLRRLDVRAATPRLARRWFELTGVRPRSWARPRDLRRLWVPAPVPGRPTLGTIGRLGRLLAAEAEWHIALFAPSGSGKTSRFVIPWLLEADGPVVVCSTKLDVVEHTIEHRSRLGRVWVWDPFGPRSSGWSPLAGCDDWGGALRRAKWLASANGAVSSDAARFWNEEASKLLAPLLHAAALEGEGVRTVLRWLDEQADQEPLAALDGAGAWAAAEQLQAVLGLDQRNRGTTFMSAANLVDAYRHPQVQARDRPEIRPEEILDGAANTLYIVASEDDQELLAPLVVSMLAELMTHAQRVARSGRPIEPALRVLADETANIAPLRQLPKYLAGVRAANVRVVTVWQDLAQLREQYRDADGTILSNSQVKLFLGPVSDERTQTYVCGLLGDEPAKLAASERAEPRRGQRSSARRPRATAQLLQQLQPGRALLVHTNLPAAVIEATPWFAQANRPTLSAARRRLARLVAQSTRFVVSVSRRQARSGDGSTPGVDMSLGGGHSEAGRA